jgi:hypothetical protein
MKKLSCTFLIFTFFFFFRGFSQPFADIASFNYQTFSAPYDSFPNWSNKTQDYFLNLFVPKEFKNGNTLLVRLNVENLVTTYWASNDPEDKYPAQLTSISVPLGMKLVTKNKKWESIFLAVPKIAGRKLDFSDPHCLQYGGIFLQHFVPGPRLKVKAGLYYNREAFGNFFVPLLGVDWKASDRISLYGILPTNYRVEFNILREKLYTGLTFKSLTRSFTMGDVWKNDYVRYDEMQVKLFLDFFVYKKFLVFAEMGYTLGKSPIQMHLADDKPEVNNVRYSPVSDYLLVNVGFAYRVRLDFDKKPE